MEDKTIIQLAGMTVVGILAIIMLYLGREDISIILGLLAMLIAPSPVNNRITRFFGKKVKTECQNDEKETFGKIYGSK